MNNLMVALANGRGTVQGIFGLCEKGDPTYHKRSDDCSCKLTDFKNGSSYKYEGTRRSVEILSSGDWLSYDLAFKDFARRKKKNEGA